MRKLRGLLLAMLIAVLMIPVSTAYAEDDAPDARFYDFFQRHEGQTSDITVYAKNYTHFKVYFKDKNGTSLTYTNAQAAYGIDYTELALEDSYWDTEFVVKIPMYKETAGCMIQVNVRNSQTGRSISSGWLSLDMCSGSTRTYEYKSSFEAAGGTFIICNDCDECIEIKNEIPGLDYYKFSASRFGYTGEVQRPTVKIYRTDGKVLTSKDYTLKFYTDGKSIGKHTGKLTLKGKYQSEPIKFSYTIVPKYTKITSLTLGKKAFTVKWGKRTVQTTGYQIQYSRKADFTGSTTKLVTIKSNKTTSKTIKDLAGGKKYYVRVRTYKTVNGKKYCSKWCKKQYVTTKK